jgi:asparagine synthase (glutamine-hydrolysing)
MDGGVGPPAVSIIDRVGGSQPMTNEDGSCWVVFNGEIYNHHGLRATLEARGHVFARNPTPKRSSTPTRSSPRAPMLEGMFAFAVYDTAGAIC